MSILEFLSVETGVPIETLERVIATAPRRYKVYDIPKRSGGTRTIAHPAKELKVLQRVILHKILDRVDVSPIAMAYVKDRGIVRNARYHLGQRWLLKLDFKDFFHSIVPRDWDRVVRRSPKLSVLSADRGAMHNLLYWGAGRKAPKCLSIGAPTSPSISNLVCLRLDEWLLEHAEKRGLRVTRYADDITVSGGNIPQLLRFEEGLAKRLARNKGVQLTLNDAKRGLYGPGERRMVTGLVLTPDNRISIGRDRKREISSLIHRFAIEGANAEQAMRAKGLLAFAHAAESTFVQAMKEKYGEETIVSLQGFNDPDLIPDPEF